MAFEQGNVANSKELFNALVTFLTTNATLVSNSQDWTVLQDTVIEDDVLNATRPGWYDRRIYLRGPGPAVGYEVYACVEAQSNHWTSQMPKPNYASTAFMLDGITGHDVNLAPENQPNSLRSSSPNYIPSFWVGSPFDHTIDYKFVANGRRFIVCYRSNYKGTAFGLWRAAYMGFLLPFGQNTEDPYPYASAAPFYRSMTTDIDARNQTNSTYSFVKPTGSSQNASATFQCYRSAAWKGVGSSTLPNIAWHIDGVAYYEKYLPPFGSSQLAVFPIIPFSRDSGLRHAFGMMDGAFIYGSADLSPTGVSLPKNGDVLQVGGVDHLITEQGAIKLQ